MVDKNIIVDFASILVKIKCLECKGSGFIQHPEWAQYWAAWEAQGKPRPLPDTSHLPEREEIECPRCDGSGLVEEHIDMETLLEFVVNKLEEKRV